MTFNAEHKKAVDKIFKSKGFKSNSADPDITWFTKDNLPAGENGLCGFFMKWEDGVISDESVLGKDREIYFRFQYCPEPSEAVSLVDEGLLEDVYKDFCEEYTAISLYEYGDERAVFTKSIYQPMFFPLGESKWRYMSPKSFSEELYKALEKDVNNVIRYDLEHFVSSSTDSVTEDYPDIRDYGDNNTDFDQDYDDEEDN